MDIEIYREFMALAAHKSFVSAARDLNMSQPSLSRHMNALANDLGCQLFYDTRPLSLTAAGEVVLKHAGKIIGDQANMLAELQALPASSNNRILILDLLHTNALYVGINEAAAQAKERFPGLRIEFVNMDNSGMGGQQMIDAKKVDISFETIISEAPTTELELSDSVEAIWVPEFHGELVAGVSRTSPLAGRESLTLKELSQSRFILQANRYSERFREDFIAMCREVGFYPNITLVPADNPLEFYATDPGDGIHLLTKVDRKYKPLISDLLKQHVEIVPFADKKRYVDAFALMKSFPDRPDLEFFSELLVEHAKRLQAEMFKG
ncbi:LysR family transcriptional regulator [Raoultibacter phocaeensis]|uniref:LysR family transcriptional regulator n=1 Tax=Raoultibacter phocaeensis TaxID=2479841 RepID=UPI00111A4CC0|nr:LysR family transcriptional regulator [Raoultibacter phocaeensis]